ncbi:MAG: hypothetical protein J0M04_16660 [Verrucomicrobia bacterium]|nr:hypothetical protein [Verrucomicrobiota bacterium]
MKPFSDQMLARRMLETRDCGYSFGLFFRRSSRRYLLLVSYFVLALVAFALFQLWSVYYLMLGMFAGCIFRDIGWVRTGGKTWPFSLKVTDWDKVQRLADEKDVV